MKRLALCLLFLSAFFAVSASAQDIQTDAHMAYIVDYQTGAVMLDKNGEERIEPASLTKLMTAYLLFEQLKSGKMSLSDKLTVSEAAWRMQGSKMFVELGNQIRLEDLLRGVIVQSGNDACVVIAEAVAGSEQAFADRMNAKAKVFGMTGTHFVNSTGWPDPDHYTTGHDLAILARHVITDFPEYYHYFSEIDFTYHGIKQGNRNPLLYKNVGADGLKTGHAEGPGYSLVASGQQEGRRIIMVVQGLDSKQARSDEAVTLWEWAFRSYENDRVVKAGAPLVDAPVWMSDAPSVPLAAKSDLVLTLPRGSRDQVRATAVFDGPLAAPVAAGIEVGTLRIEAPGMSPVEVPLVTAGHAERLGAFRRMILAARHLILG